MENECKCPNCKKKDLVYPSNNPTLGSYVCLRCCYIFDGKEKKHDSKTANQ